MNVTKSCFDDLKLILFSFEHKAGALSVGDVCMCALTYHGVQKLDASLHLWSGLTVKTEQKSPDGLLLTQAEVVPV